MLYAIKNVLPVTFTVGLIVHQFLVEQTLPTTHIKFLQGNLQKLLDFAESYYKLICLVQTAQVYINIICVWSEYSSI